MLVPLPSRLLTTTEPSQSRICPPLRPRRHPPGLRGPSQMPSKSASSRATSTWTDCPTGPPMELPGQSYRAPRHPSRFKSRTIYLGTQTGSHDLSGRLLTTTYTIPPYLRRQISSTQASVQQHIIEHVPASAKTKNSGCHIPPQRWLAHFACVPTASTRLGKDSYPRRVTSCPDTTSTPSLILSFALICDDF